MSGPSAESLPASSQPTKKHKNKPNKKKNAKPAESDANPRENGTQKTNHVNRRDMRASNGHARHLYQHNRGQKRSQADASPGTAASASVEVNKLIPDGDPPFRRISQVGQGTYGTVYKAQDVVTKKFLAMKLLRIDNENEGFPVTAAREVKLLQRLNHQNIVKLSEMVVSKNEIYMALDYIEHDLAGLLLNKDLVILPAHVKSLFKQTLSALAFLHGQNILHRDVKGSNLLVTSNGTVKLADFGLARHVDMATQHRKVRLTNRVITMWYRPPELLLGTEYYGSEVDIWGAGCLLVELFTRQPLFHGKDEISQIQAIYSVMGAPTEASWPGYTDMPWFHLIDSVENNNGAAPAYRFNRVFSGHNITPACFDLANELLRLNPLQRISASSALEHEYFREEPRERKLELHMEHEWHDWEAKKRKKNTEAA